MPFLAADCHFDQGEYPVALAAYERLAARYAERLEGLNALGGMVRCYSALGDTEKMEQALARIEQMLPKMPDPVRLQWSEWLKTAQAGQRAIRDSRQRHQGHKGDTEERRKARAPSAAASNPGFCFSLSFLCALGVFVVNRLTNG